MCLLILNCLHCVCLKSWHENTDNPSDDTHADDDKEEPSPKEDSDVDSDSDQMYENVKVGECSGHEICCICKIVHWISPDSHSCSQLQPVGVTCV